MQTAYLQTYLWVILAAIVSGREKNLKLQPQFSIVACCMFDDWIQVWLQNDLYLFVKCASVSASCFFLFKIGFLAGFGAKSEKWNLCFSVQPVHFAHFVYTCTKMYTHIHTREQYNRITTCEKQIWNNKNRNTRKSHTDICLRKTKLKEMARWFS